MTLQAQWNLTYDDPFRSRSRACLTNEALTFGDDPEASSDVKALAEDILLEDPAKISTFLTLIAGYSDFATRADNGDGTVDSTKIVDSDIKLAVDNLFPGVAALFYGAASVPPPMVTGVAPTTGVHGNTVTVTGTGLTGTANVNIAEDCPSFSVVSDTEVTAVVPDTTQKGAFPVLVTIGATVFTGPNFTIT